MQSDSKFGRFPGNLVMVGFGSIGQAVLPLVLRHLDIKPGKIRIIAADNDGQAVAREFGGRFVYHASGVAGTFSDPGMDFSIPAQETQTWDDILAAMLSVREAHGWVQ